MENYTGLDRRGATASASLYLRNHGRRREKVFGQAPGIRLDRNAKVRISVYARSWNVRHRQTGQHKGPLTRTFLEILDALLFVFCNNRDGRCFPSYETIAARAGCARSSVAEAIKALERAGIVTWVNRLTKIRVRTNDLFGIAQSRWQVIRVSNACGFR